MGFEYGLLRSWVVKEKTINNGLGLDIELGLDMGLRGWWLLKASELVAFKKPCEVGC